MTQTEKNLKVAIVTPELYGYKISGGLGVAVYGLVAALKRKEVDVRVIMPECSRDEESLADINLQTDFVEGRFPLRDLYGDSKREFFNGYNFSSAIPECVKGLKEGEKSWVPDIIHLHEWHTAMAASILKRDSCFSEVPILLTIHNVDYVGRVPTFERDDSYLKGNPGVQEALVDALQIGPDLFRSLLEIGCFYADAVNTVSPSYAHEVLTGSAGVDERIVRVLKGLEGILNGIDPVIMNPSTDPYIVPFDPQDMESVAYGKGLNKLRLCAFFMDWRKRSSIEAEIKPNANAMWVTMMARLVEQKGIDFVLGAVDEISKMDNVQLLIVGEKEYGSKYDFMGLNKKGVISYPYFVGAKLQHQILAGSDAILMPSRKEPCGLVQMEGMTYGALPITTLVGGLKDTVIPASQEESGYGIIIEEHSPQGVANAINQASELFEDKSAWRRHLSNALMTDFSWDRDESVGRYIQLYERLIQKKQA